MASKIKDFFIPHQYNAFMPRLLAIPVLASLAGLVVVAHVFFFQLHGTKGSVLGYATDISRSEIIALSNQQRAGMGIQELKLNPNLQQAAQAKANDMAARGYWDHFTPEGIAPWSFIDQAGYTYEYAGENLARDFETSRGVVEGWLKSPTHRDNLLDSKYKDVGVGVADGELDGSQTTFVVAIYAAPEAAVALQPELEGQSLGIFNEKSNSLTYGVLRPLSPLATLNWAVKLGLGILIVVAIVFLSQHLVLKRHRLRWDKHTHSHPLFMTGLLSVCILMALIASYGSVL